MEIEIVSKNEDSNALAAPAVSSVLARIAPKAEGLLARMFADPICFEGRPRSSWSRIA